jgi:hypothetical protein
MIRNSSGRNQKRKGERAIALAAYEDISDGRGVYTINL